MLPSIIAPNEQTLKKYPMATDIVSDNNSRTIKGGDF